MWIDSFSGDRKRTGKRFSSGCFRKAEFCSLSSREMGRKRPRKAVPESAETASKCVDCQTIVGRHDKNSHLDRDSGGQQGGGWGVFLDW